MMYVQPRQRRAYASLVDDTQRPSLHVCMHRRVHPNESKQTVVSGTPAPLLSPGTGPHRTRCTA